MKNSFLIFGFLFISTVCKATGAFPYSHGNWTDSNPKKPAGFIIQNEKLYCSPFAKTRYNILVNGNKLKITRLYKEYVDVIKGVLKNGKIYSDDPNEKNLKALRGKYYKLKGKSFSVLNIENGEYELFTLCKE